MNKKEVFKKDFENSINLLFTLLSKSSYTTSELLEEFNYDINNETINSLNSVMYYGRDKGFFICQDILVNPADIEWMLTQNGATLLENHLSFQGNLFKEKTKELYLFFFEKFNDIEKETKIDEEKREKKREILFLYLSLIKDKKWGEATELLCNYIKNILYIYTTKDDIKSEMWIYKDGIYVPQGKSEVKEILRDLLEMAYSNFVYNQVIAKLEPDTYIDQDKFFNILYKDEIPVKNGILNIMTKQLKPFDPRKIFFNKLPISFDPTKKCDKINKFLEEVLDSPETIKTLKEYAGFSLLKEYRFEKALMMVGDGRNGKGKTIELLKHLIGIENCCSVPLSSLTSENFSISELFGKMLNIVGDIGSNNLKETDMFKHLTGRDLVSGKRKFLRDITFYNYAKFIFACNDLPMVYDMSRGFWDRWILFEFPNTFVSQEELDSTENKSCLKLIDEDVINKITTPDELSGFLNEALEGLHRLLENHKFSISQNCEEIKNRWIRKSNSFMGFCYEFIEEGEGEEFITKKELRKTYTSYCKKHKVSAKSDFVIKRTMQESYGANEEYKKVNDFSDYESLWVGVRWKTIENKQNNNKSSFNDTNFSDSKDFKDIIPYRGTKEFSYNSIHPSSPKNDTFKGAFIEKNEIIIEKVDGSSLENIKSPQSPKIINSIDFEENSKDLDSNYVFENESMGKKKKDIPFPSSPDDQRIFERSEIK